MRSCYSDISLSDRTMSKILSFIVAISVVALATTATEAGHRGWTGGEVKPGHYSIKEFHFHVYFRRNFQAEGTKEPALRQPESRISNTCQDNPRQDENLTSLSFSIANETYPQLLVRLPETS